MHHCFSYIFAHRMILRYILSIIVFLVTFFAVEDSQPDCESASVASGHFLYEVSIEEVATQTAVGCESLPHLDGVRRFHRSHTPRILSEGNSLAKVNIHSGVCQCGQYPMNNIHFSGADDIGKVDSYIFWRNLRI